jgi:hypothetical protein
MALAGRSRKSKKGITLRHHPVSDIIADELAE